MVNIAPEESSISLAGGDVLRYDTSELEAWDTGLLALLLRLEQAATERDVTIDRSGLPEGARRLLALAESSPARDDARRDTGKAPWLDRVGASTIAAAASGRPCARADSDIARR